jgi:two-component system NtrC family response regulator
LRKYSDGNLPLSEAALALLVRYDWPGNVRELENTVQRMVVLRRGDRLDVADLPDKIRGSQLVAAGRPSGVVQLPDGGCSLEVLEREVVLQALERNGWNQSRAAMFLRIPRHVLLYRMEKYGIHKP